MLFQDLTACFFAFGRYRDISVSELPKTDKLSAKAERHNINRAEFWRRVASGEIRIPKGVFRFKTFEEADEWWEIVGSGGQPPKKN